MEEKDSILIVDDIEINRVILREILGNDYEILEAADGFAAVECLYQTDCLPQAVLLDIMMPGMDGFEVLEIIKANPLTEKIPVLFITAADANMHESRGLKEGAVDYISKPFDPDVVKARVDNHIQLKRYRTELETLVEKKTADLMKVHTQMLETMAAIIEYRSLESGTHIRRTGDLMRILIARMLAKPMFHQELIDSNYGAMIKAVVMHDIGKVAIPDNILLKPGRLTAEEFEVIKTHTVIGADIIASISSNMSDDEMYLRHCREICRFHHERWDGKGYPDGLSGTDIPLAARVLSVLDVYDALVSERCYKASVPHEKAVAIIEEGAGTQFDPNIVEVFLEIQDECRKLESDLEKVG
ncbi:MAG: response regulator [Peptococcaceae bacterium]|nr:response regulator [Peptococcaceae bacterium]